VTTIDLPLSDYQRALRGLSIPEVLDAVAARHGDVPALVHVEDPSTALTWAQLRDQVSRVRSGLQQLGVKAGDRVAMQLRNQVEFPLSWFAIAELGAAAVPLNPSYTMREADFVLRDADVNWLLITDDILKDHGDARGYGPVPSDRIITVGGLGDSGHQFGELATATPTALAEYPDHNSVANIQFTSGTTGLPKGCLLTHRYWVEVGVWMAAVFDARRTLADHPFYYMLNQAYLMAAIATGGTLYVTPGLSRKKFLGWLADHQIDLAWIDEGMLECPRPESRDPLALKRAPVAAVTPADQRKLEESFGLLAREFYASTEVGVGTFVPWDHPELARQGSMGYCFPTRESKVVDESLNEVPAGVVGELCLRGEGMMLGYHNRPEVNQELFLPGGWFRTGDLVRKDPDGAHYYVGRLKDVIRRSGENISCAEVELHLMAMPEVAEAAVVPVADVARGEEVKAILVLAEGASIDPGEIIRWAREGLAPFKIPRYLEFRDSLPRTSSGKVHKAVLREETSFTDATIDMQAEREHPATTVS
jgi:acyl-CoA synthetase (AMP-forming)/AMP-acid ligase II